MSLLKILGIDKYTVRLKDWVNNKIDIKISDLVNAAPETLDTLGELASAIQENETLVDALDAAITGKADKSEIPTKLSQLEQDIEIGGKTDSKIIETTYYNLVSLRNNLELIPGQQYRITDYITTTTQDFTQSAGHRFDIIVTADDEKTLNEIARAILHNGDAYFANSDLNAWQLWYCLDNDISRFAWADTANGKGVIYRMIDEFNNDCPYDFKNIQFEYFNTETYPGYYYTFTNLINGVISDKSLIQGYCYENVINEFLVSKNIQLNEIIFINTSEMNFCSYNSFGSGCNSNSFGSDCNSNSFGSSCSYNSFGSGCNSNSFGSDCNSNSFGNYYSYNSFGSGCNSNSFGNYCNYNSFGNYCSYNSFGNCCSYNSFGNYCSYNSFGNYCSYNSFRSSKAYSFDYTDIWTWMPTGTLLNYVRNNHFGDGCFKVAIVCTSTLSSSKCLQNLDIAQGLRSIESKYFEEDDADYEIPLFVTIDTAGQDYEIKVARNTSGDVKVFTLADIIA